MYPRPNGWQPQFNKFRFIEKKKRPSSFRSINGDRRQLSIEERIAQGRHRKYVPAGMFANAKSSLPQISSISVEEQISLTSQPGISKSYSTPPPKVSKTWNISRRNQPQNWDFSDISPKRDEPVKHSLRPPFPKRLNSEEEDLPKNDLVQDEPVKQEKQLLPWLKKWNSEDEATSKIPRKVEKLEAPPGFDKTIARFTARLDRLGAIPTLSLQNHTNTTLGTIEKALIASAVAEPETDGIRKSVPVFDMLVERSDWLMFREEFNDETDYLPRDPFFSHDVVSSEFEEYEQEKEAAYNPSYSKLLKPVHDDKDEIDDNDVISDLPGFLKKSCDGDSQEDFFDERFLTTSRASDRYRSPDGNFSLFDDSAPSTSNARVSTKRSHQSDFLDSGAPSTSEKRSCPENPLDNVPRLELTSNYSPFNYSFLSQSSPPKSSPRPSKYSFW